MSFLVEWAMDIESVDTPREAAELCREMMLDPNCEAVVYSVFDHESGIMHRVDLLEEE